MAFIFDDFKLEIEEDLFDIERDSLYFRRVRIPDRCNLRPLPCSYSQMLENVLPIELGFDTGYLHVKSIIHSRGGYSAVLSHLIKRLNRLYRNGNVGERNMFNWFKSETNLRKFVSLPERLPGAYLDMIQASMVNPSELTLRNITNEMRWFADRSIYDAYATVLTRNAIPTKRVIRDYTLESASRVASQDNIHQYCPDVDKVAKIGEDGIAAMRNLFNDRWHIVYTGIRDSYFMVNRRGVLEAFFDLSTDESANKLTFSTYGPEVMINLILETLSDNFDLLIDRTLDRLELQLDGSIISNTISLKDPERYVKGIYPNMDVTPEELLNSFQASNSRALIFYGQPGCGKSSYMTAMIAIRGYHNLVLCDDNQLYDNPSLINHIRQYPNGTWFIFEDCDNLLSKRSDGNRQMSALLNTISGIGERDYRFIFLTNLRTLKDVDDALLRPGRAYRKLEFKPISVEHVNDVLRKLDKSMMSDEDLAGKTFMTLSEIIHHGDGIQVEKFGFN